MSNLVDPHCPGDDPSRKSAPQIVACPKEGCAGEIEIWTDEKNGKCATCKTTFSRDDLNLT